MGQRLGQPIIVENRPGAGGNVGTAMAARARGDAHLVLVGSTGPLSVSPITEAQLGYDPVADLIPITLLNATPLVSQIADHVIASFIATSWASR